MKKIELKANIPSEFSVSGKSEIKIKNESKICVTAELFNSFGSGDRKTFIDRAGTMKVGKYTFIKFIGKEDTIIYIE